MFRATLIAVALTAGGGAAWLALAMPSRDVPMPEAVMAPATRTVEILVAAAEIPQGGEVLPEQMEWRAWPEDALHAGFVSRALQPDAITELQGSVARSGFVAGEPIRAEKLAPVGAGFLSATLEPGTRAVAVRISAENTAGGFILPNDRVDILHTTTCAPEEACDATSRTRAILRNVKVLAIDQQGTQGSPETVVVGKTATLELTPAQAELVIGAEASGMLSLALRPVTDNGEAQDVAQRAVQPEENRTVRVRRAGVAEEVVLR